MLSQDIEKQQKRVTSVSWIMLGFFSTFRALLKPIYQNKFSNEKTEV